ncbi:MAG: hypothetical protein LUG50_06730 [Planctomycetaceae bacterium]|nr:hypothetical protein [Planctomycetaceae bacterium]
MKRKLRFLDEEYLKARDFIKRFCAHKDAVSAKDIGFIASRICHQRGVKRRREQTYIGTHWWDDRFVYLYPTSILKEAEALCSAGCMEEFRCSSIFDYLKNKPPVDYREYEKELLSYTNIHKLPLKPLYVQVEKYMDFKSEQRGWRFSKCALDAVYAKLTRGSTQR